MNMFYNIIIGQPQTNAETTGMHRHVILAALWLKVIKITDYLKSTT